MLSIIRRVTNTFCRREDGERKTPPQTGFFAWRYQQHNQRRLEHLASLGLDLKHKTVLELGAGIGDHTSFFLDRECSVTCLEARQENLDILSSRFKDVKAVRVDLDDPFATEAADLPTYDIVYCYGLLYHLSKPETAIRFMSEKCGGILLLETCVSYGNDLDIHLIDEKDAETQSYCGVGCRPTRPWLYTELQKYFTYVYLPKTQPNHVQFPIDWNTPLPEKQLVRSVFVCTNTKLDNPVLTQELLHIQEKAP